MSILASLAKAYDRFSLADDMPLPGYSSQNIHGCIVLDLDGILNGRPVIWDPDERGHLTTKSMNVPYFGGRSGKKPPPYFLWDNTAYVLGVTAKPKIDASQRFNAFKSFHQAALTDCEDPGLIALVRFLHQWDTKNYASAGFTDNMRDKNFVFRLSGDVGFIHERTAAKTIWQSINQPDTAGQGLCLVTGERSLIARLHPPLVSFENPARIVAFDKDNDAFASYGHVQGENAPISIQAAFAYSAALNKLLSKDSRNRIQIGDASTVFWADASNAPVVELAETAFSAMFAGVDEATQAAKVGNILKRIRNGQPLSEVAPELAEGVRFHVLGLAPNAARLSIRFWFENDFGVLAKNYQRFVREMAVLPNPRDENPAIWKYLAETAVLRKRENVPPNLAGEWMRTILTGTPYPLTLLSTILMRIRADGDLNGLRVGILKALLIRNFRKTEREAPVSFDPENTNKGYLLGRLFAAYEQAQSAALGRHVNATIKDKFYGAASAQPRKVFPLLDRSSANHLSKVGKQRPGQRVNLEKTIASIVGKMSPTGDPFPASLPAEDQALFALGYYHQRNEFFRKPETNNRKDTDQ
jgi:CRISPR-associated protein Csd1